MPKLEDHQCYQHLQQPPQRFTWGSQKNSLLENWYATCCPFGMSQVLCWGSGLPPQIEEIPCYPLPNSLLSCLVIFACPRRAQQGALSRSSCSKASVPICSAISDCVEVDLPRKLGVSVSLSWDQTWTTNNRPSTHQQLPTIQLVQPWPPNWSFNKFFMVFQNPHAMPG